MNYDTIRFIYRKTKGPTKCKQKSVARKNQENPIWSKGVHQRQCKFEFHSQNAISPNMLNLRWENQTPIYTNRSDYEHDIQKIFLEPNITKIKNPTDLASWYSLNTWLGLNWERDTGAPRKRHTLHSSWCRGTKQRQSQNMTEVSWEDGFTVHPTQTDLPRQDHASNTRADNGRHDKLGKDNSQKGSICSCPMVNGEEARLNEGVY